VSYDCFPSRFLVKYEQIQTILNLTCEVRRGKLGGAFMLPGKKIVRNLGV
jgi:hypothetical protein